MGPLAVTGNPSPHSSGGNRDGDLAKMKEEMRELQEEERRLKKAAEVDTMRRRLEEQKKVKHLRGRTDISTGQRNLETEREKISDLRSRSELHDCDDEGITLDTLRKDKKLRDLVKKELKNVV